LNVEATSAPKGNDDQTCLFVTTICFARFRWLLCAFLGGPAVDLALSHGRQLLFGRFFLLEVLLKQCRAVVSAESVLLRVSSKRTASRQATPWNFFYILDLFWRVGGTDYLHGRK
jgi:hypothetical protein